MKVLTIEQKVRLYNVFDFDDMEEITFATLKNGVLKIYFIDHRDSLRIEGVYEPNLEGDEGQEKLDFIMNGLKLERNK